MDSGISACSPGSIVEDPDSTHHGKPLVAEGLEAYPFWSSAKAEGLENPPPYTDGPSRIILANDGTKDCLALLLTPDLVAALDQIPHDILASERKHRALENIKSEILNLSCKADIVEDTIRNARYQDRAEEMQLALEILQLKQQEAKERRSQLDIELMPIESNLKMSRHQSQEILEEALLEACLLDPPEPDIPSVFHDVEDDASAGDYADAPSVYEGIEATPEQRLLREARMDVVESYDTLRIYRARFDDRQADYERQLADLECSEARCEGTRTQFDHQHIRHVQSLTRDLVMAEQGYRTAKAKAWALELPANLNGDKQIFAYLADEGGRMGGDLLTEPSVDRERIEAWRRGVLPNNDEDILENKELLDLGGWNARPVEIMDSVSAIDREEYIDEINDWREHCRVLREEASTGLVEREIDGL